MVNRLFIQILDTTGKSVDDFGLIARSGVLAGNISQREIWKTLSYKLPNEYRFMTANEKSRTSHPLRIILYPVKKGIQGKYLIEVGTSLKKVFGTLNSFVFILIISGPIMVLVSTLGGYFLLTGALRPVALVVKTARRISTEDLSLRIPTNNIRKDEIGLLVTTLNEMIAGLEQSVARIKQFSTDASHDLKTPLTVIRGEIELALRKNRSREDYRITLNTLYEETQKMETITNNLLFLSRVDAVDYKKSFRSIPLDEILLNVFEKTERLAGEKQIAYILYRIESVSIHGDEILLSRLITNILENAIKYTPKGGRIEILLEKINGHAIMTFRDNGIGIPEESIPFIFDRFYRVDKARSQEIGGSGLGLSIVKKISELHGAGIKVESKLNRGTSFTIDFPECCPDNY